MQIDAVVKLNNTIHQASLYIFVFVVPHPSRRFAALRSTWRTLYEFLNLRSEWQCQAVNNLLLSEIKVSKDGSVVRTKRTMKHNK